MQLVPFEQVIHKDIQGVHVLPSRYSPALHFAADAAEGKADAANAKNKKKLKDLHAEKLLIKFILKIE